jgi:hypothetical protein
MNYRQELFTNYRTVQALPARPDLEKADHWGQAYDTYLHGWLPSSREARRTRSASMQLPVKKSATCTGWVSRLRAFARLKSEA